MKCLSYQLTEMQDSCRLGYTPRCGMYSDPQAALLATGRTRHKLRLPQIPRPGDKRKASGSRFPDDKHETVAFPRITGVGAMSNGRAEYRMWTEPIMKTRISRISSHLPIACGMCKTPDVAWETLTRSTMGQTVARLEARSQGHHNHGSNHGRGPVVNSILWCEPIARATRCSSWGIVNGINDNRNH